MSEKLELIRVGKDPDRKIEALIALIATDPKTGFEGIVSAGDSPTSQMPLVFTAGNPFLGHAMELARRAGQEHGFQIEVRRFECVNREAVT